MTRMPQGWVNASLENLTSFAIGGAWGKEPSEAEPDFVEVRCIRGTELRHWDRDFGATAAARSINPNSLLSRALQPNDLVVEISGGGPDQPVGRTVRITERVIETHFPVPVICTNFFRRVELSDANVAPYVEKFLRFDYSSGGTVDIQSGSNNLRNLNFSAFLEKTIPLPPLPEQRRIVRKLDTLSARSTTARTHLTAIEKLVERYKLAVLTGSLFRNGTPVKRLGEVLTDIRYGTAAKCSYDPSGTPVLRIPNIQSGRIDRTDLKSAHFAKKEIEQLALKAGDILVIRSNGSSDLVGRVALVTDGETDCLFAGYLIRLRLSATEALPEYVRLCFESDEVRAIIEAASKSTSGVNNVNSTQLKEIALPMPTVDEQREIVCRIETAFAKIDRLKAEAAKALKLLGHLDQRILAKAFAGDLVPQDPNDEPAETLLARIVEARATAPKVRRGRKAKP